MPPTPPDEPLTGTYGGVVSPPLWVGAAGGMGLSVDVGGVGGILRGSECPGGWRPRPPGVLSCLPSEGAGSGARPHLLSVPELCRYLAESWLTFQIHLQELLQYKRQNPAQVTSPVADHGWGSTGAS